MTHKTLKANGWNTCSNQIKSNNSFKNMFKSNHRTWYWWFISNQINDQHGSVWSSIDIFINQMALDYLVLSSDALTLWGLGTWNFTSPRDWAPFGDFLFYFLNQSFICSGSQFSSLFTILQDRNVIFFLHHQVHHALNDITMTPPWCYNTGTYMSFPSLNKGWTYMSFQSSKC